MENSNLKIETHKNKDGKLTLIQEKSTYFL